MYSSMIGKIEKSIRYSQEPERIAFNDFSVTLEGDHRNHTVTYHGGEFGCDCEIFTQTGYCSHSMAMERVLRGMIHTEVPSPTAPSGS